MSSLNSSLHIWRITAESSRDCPIVVLVSESLSGCPNAPLQCVLVFSLTGKAGNTTLNLCSSGGTER